MWKRYFDVQMVFLTRDSHTDYYGYVKKKEISKSFQRCQKCQKMIKNSPESFEGSVLHPLEEASLTRPFLLVS
jgi:hypothetical protein